MSTSVHKLFPEKPKKKNLVPKEAKKNKSQDVTLKLHSFGLTSRVGATFWVKDGIARFSLVMTRSCCECIYCKPAQQFLGIFVHTLC